MKKLFAAFFAFQLLISVSHAQESEVRPRAIGISFFLNDFVTANRIRTTSLSSVIRDRKFAKLSQMSAGMAINYFNGITKHIDFAATLGGSFVNYPMPNKVFDNDNLLLEASAMVNLKMTTEKYWVQPFIIAGVGGHRYKNYYGAFMPLGLGLKVNLFDEAHFFITSQYRVAITTETSNYHFNHAIGLAMALGKKKIVVPPPPPPPPPPVDTDGDGITDDKDKCPTVPGVAKYDGCPVPDTDKDGINDDNDKCPTVPGLARYDGCPIPDTDKDGINDEEDKCPNVPGVARYQGCPVPDTDGDGVNDEEDQCRTEPGPRENKGCPVISEEVKKTADYAAKNILFVTGSYKLVASSFKGLDDVAKILNDNPKMILAIDGHTDNVGTDAYNQTLSDNRAGAVKAYFVKKGVDASRITSTGHGEGSPIADNATAEGRKENRRVELKITYGQ
ncbi:MAG TPA: OmpA family protein [Chitinophagaceae bacterium]|nr:OmpA family protein [Chitinophagaceae bacterium]